MTEADSLPWRELPPVVLCERTGQWAAWWRGIKPSIPVHERPRMIETRGLNECRGELDRHPAALVALELTAGNAEAVVELLAEQERYWPQAAMVVVAEQDLATWEPIVREAGALGWSTSPRRLRPLVDMACRHAARRARPFDTIDEAIESLMPWRRE